jgi:hypothetical protein
VSNLFKVDGDYQTIAVDETKMKLKILDVTGL